MPDQTNLNIQQLFNKDALAEAEKATVASGDWMSVQDASNATGLSMGTLRRYIKARKLKSRRLGRSINAKLEVWVTPDLMPDGTDGTGSGEIFEFDGEVESDQSADDEEHMFADADHSDQSNAATLAWMRRKLDEKDALLREKDSKIERLAHELTGAHYRNGYLEAEKSKFEEKLLLLEDKSKTIEKEVLIDQPAKIDPEPTSGPWTKFSRWFIGKP